MRPNQTLDASDIRRLHYFLLTLLLLATAISCQSPSPDTNKPAGGQNNNSTPTPTKDYKFRDEADRPIIITGGSVDLMFDTNDYQPEAASSPEAKQFRSNNYRIKTINVFKDDASGENDPELLCGPEDGALGIQAACADGGCRVVVKYKKNGDQKITIDSFWTGADKRVQIEFSTLKLLRRLTKKAHSSRGAKIDGIEYHTSPGATSGLTPCTAGRKTTVEIDTCKHDAANPTACPLP